MSRLRFEKGGREFQASLDPQTATVKVSAGEALQAHTLEQHYGTTSSKHQEVISSLVNDGLSAVGAPDFVGRNVRAFTFMPTSRCNMGCTYCGQEHTRGNVSAAVADRFLGRVTTAFNSPRIAHVHVAWFGGEPLLAFRSIIDLSVAITSNAQASGKEYSSKITTNGALLTPRRMQQLIEDAQVSRFDITVDGTPDVHNRHRPLKGGGGSFESIMRTLSWFRTANLSRPALVVLRTNVDKDNLADIPRYLTLMKEHGFDDSARFLYELSPIHSWGNDVSATALTTFDAARAEIEWMTQMENIQLPFGLLPGKPASITCVATDRRSEVIGSEGNLLSCTETPLTGQAADDTLGNILTMAAADNRPLGKFDGWDLAVAEGRLPCSTCALRIVCRGACPKQWSEGSVPCPTLKLNFDARLAIFMRRHGYEAVSVA